MTLGRTREEVASLEGDLTRKRNAEEEGRKSEEGKKRAEEAGMKLEEGMKKAELECGRATEEVRKPHAFRVQGSRSYTICITP